MNNPLNKGAITRKTAIIFTIVALLIITIVAAAVTYSLQTSEPKTVTGIDPVNAAPVIDSYLPVSLSPSVAEGANLAFSVSTHDPEGQALAYSWTLDGIVKSNSATYDFLGTAAQHTVKVDVSDGFSTASITWTLTITVVDTYVNIPVTLTVSSTSVIRDHSHYLTLTATIPDAHGQAWVIKFYQNGAFIGQANVVNLQADITIYGDTLVKGDNVFTAGP